MDRENNSLRNKAAPPVYTGKGDRALEATVTARCRVPDSMRDPRPSCPDYNIGELEIGYLEEKLNKVEVVHTLTPIWCAGASSQTCTAAANRCRWPESVCEPCLRSEALTT